MSENNPESYNWLASVIMTITLAVVGGFTKVIWGRTAENSEAAQRVSDRLANHKLHLAETYVPKDDFKDFGDRMDKQFDEIKSLLRSKS